jgi:Protein of unknown function (DUF3575)
VYRYLVRISSSALLASLALQTLPERTALAESATSTARDPLNTVTFSPMPLVFNRELDLEYERAVSDDFSLFVGPSLLLGTTTPCTCSYSGYGVTGGARFFAGRAPSGVFLGVFGTAFSASVSPNGSSTSANGFAYEAGGMLGYTFIIGGHFDLSLGAGAAYAHEQLTLSDAGNSVTVGSNGVIPALRLALGVAF